MKDKMEDTEYTAQGKESEPLSCEENDAEAKHIRAWVRMVCRRKEAGQPDVDKAWETFRRTIVVPPQRKRRFTAWHLTAAAIAGAAAMWGAVVLFSRSALPDKEPVRQGKEVVALRYDASPRQVKLEQEEATIDLTQKDSLSYRSASTAVLAKIAPRPAMPQRLSTPRGMDFKVILPDGSEVLLNAESTIEFPASFQNGERRVKLRGEAYFKVAHDEKSPFIVQSDQFSVKVLGTEFNMKCYAFETARIALVKGKVEVARPGADRYDAMLHPGEEAWYDENGEIRVEEVDTYAVTQWINGFFYFHDQPLIKVLRDLGRWYNLGVVFQNTEALHYKVHFSALRDEEVEAAIESLNRLRRIRVRLDGNNLVVY